MEIDKAMIATTVITELAKDAAKSIRDSICKYIKDESAKAEIDYGDAFERYLQIASEKNSKIKTLIYRHEPKELEDIYECVGVSKGKQNIDTNSVNNLLEIGHKIIITGTGGVGKSTLIKHLFLDTIKETSYIPILVELRGINSVDTDKIELEDLICTSLKNYGMSMKKEHFIYSLEAGRLAMVLLIKNRGDVSDDIETIGRKVLISAGFIGLALKLAALYGILMLAGATIVMFIVIIAAFGLIFEGKLKDIIGAFYIAKIIAKIAIFLDSWTDPIINFVIKKEFEWLGIATI